MQTVDYLILFCAAGIILFAGLSIVPSAPSTDRLEKAYNQSCGQLILKGCDRNAVATITAMTSGSTVYTLGNICASMGLTDAVSCANSCGCRLKGNTTALFDTPLRAYSDNPVTEGAVIIDDELVYDEE